MKHGLFSLMVLLALVLAIAACGGGADEPAPAATDAPVAAAPVEAPQEAAPVQQEAAPAATNTPVPPTATPVPPAPTAAPEAEDEEPMVEELAGLEQLDSYRVLVTYTTKGSDAEDNPVDNSAEILTEYTKDPAASRTVFTIIDNVATDADEGTLNWEIFQIGQDMYMSMGDEMGWIRTTAEDSPLEGSILGVFSSGDFFTNLDQMQRVRPDERINGIDSRHYRFNERVLATVFDENVDNIEATGDVWIAKDGDFVTKYVVTITYSAGRGDGLSGELVSGTTEIAFEVQDINTPFTIEIPAEATAGARLAGFEEDGFPMPPGASTQVASANFAIFESEMTVDELTTFFEEALANLGWSKDEQSSMSFGSMSSLAFTKGDNQLSIVLNANEETGMTEIMVNAE